MNHLDLFSGIGGFAYAASQVWENHNIVSFVEIDEFCQKVLKKHWPDVPIHSDIKEYKHNGTAIDLLTGGFPCQPFSVAGKQRGTEDDRALWPKMLGIIQEIRPTWIIGENVVGIINMELDKVLSDLEDSAYEVQSFLIPACAVEASHRRDRVWIVANSVCGRLQKNESQINWAPRNVQLYKSRTPCDISRDLPVKWNGREGNCSDLRKGDGIPNGLDRLKSLGNAIVPQVVIPIMQAIKNIESASPKKPRKEKCFRGDYEKM